MRAAARHRRGRTGHRTAVRGPAARIGRGPDLAAGLVWIAGAGLLVADLALAGAGLPGAPVFAVVAAAIRAYAAVVALRACARPESRTDWRAAVRGAGGRLGPRRGGSALALLALVAAVLCAWMLVPLAFLVPGPGDGAHRDRRTGPRERKSPLREGPLSERPHPRPQRRGRPARPLSGAPVTARKTFLAALAHTGVPLDTAFVELLTATAETSAKAVLDGYGADLVDSVTAARPARPPVRRAPSSGCTCTRARRTTTPPRSWVPPPNSPTRSPRSSTTTGCGSTVDGNPADTAFSIVDLSLIHHLLEEDAHEPTTGLRATIERILRLAGPSLATGGVHTANHRWLVCAAFARIHARWPDPAYPERIETWLAEGIDQLPGGEYSERSPNYSAAVTNPALLVLARHYGRRDLYANVRDNLAANLYVIEPNGEVETVHSRRQDQTRVRHLPEFWLQYREMALRDGDGRFGRGRAAPGARHRPDLRRDPHRRAPRPGTWTGLEWPPRCPK